MNATIRPPRPDDQGYIAKTWQRSAILASGGSAGHAMMRHGAQRETPAPSKGERRQQLIRELNAKIDRVLDRRDTRALVAVQPGNGAGRDYILAWVVYIDAATAGLPIVHYAYTRDHDADTGEALRGRGLIRAIFERIGIARSTPVVCTSDGPSSAAMREHFRASTYHPLDQFLSPTRRA